MSVINVASVVLVPTTPLLHCQLLVNIARRALCVSVAALRKNTQVSLFILFVGFFVKPI